MFIPDPGSWFLPIPDPGSRISDPGSKNSNKRERWKKISCHTFLCSHKFHKIVNYFSFEELKKKIWANFQRIIELFCQQNCQKALKNMVLGSGIRDPRSGIRDPRSGIRKKPIPDPGSRGQKAPNPGSRIRIRNTGKRGLLESQRDNVTRCLTYFESAFIAGWSGLFSFTEQMERITVPGPFFR